MSLPRYVVNMDEGLPYLLPEEEGEDEEVIELERGYQRCKGLMLEVKNGYGVAKWEVDRPMYITGFNLSNDWGDPRYPHERYDDTLTFKVGDKVIMDNKPMRPLSTYSNQRNFLVVGAGEILSFTYKSKPQIGESNEDKCLWIDVDFIADPVLQRVWITGIDEEGEQLYRDRYDVSKGDYRVRIKEIDGYYTPDLYYHLVVNPNYDNPKNMSPHKVDIVYRKERS